LLGSYRHPVTGNDLIGGINLNYLSPRQKLKLKIGDKVIIKQRLPRDDTFMQRLEGKKGVIESLNYSTKYNGLTGRSEKIHDGYYILCSDSQHGDVEFVWSDEIIPYYTIKIIEGKEYV
jgi:bifunctional DNA-binding transcriptional regulator/antitoxin component of YhaV-PrlF toxin-antitoxin module